jgi:hypothetical protein
VDSLLLDPAKQHDDLRLIRRAMKQRWEIPDTTRKLILDRITAIVTDGTDDLALKAIAEIRHMEAQNQKDEHKFAELKIQQHNTRMDDIAAELGIDPRIVIDAAGDPGGSPSSIAGPDTEK